MCRGDTITDGNGGAELVNKNESSLCKLSSLVEKVMCFIPRKFIRLGKTKLIESCQWADS